MIPNNTIKSGHITPTSIQMLSVLEKTNTIPNDLQKRLSMITAFYEGYSFITYDALCEISSEFKDFYNTNHIRTLLRKYNIIGKNIQSELNDINGPLEDKMILKLFFKGKVDEL